MINLSDFISRLPSEQQQRVRALADEFIKSLDDNELSIEKFFIDYLAEYRDDEDDYDDDYMGINANFKAF